VYPSTQPKTHLPPALDTERDSCGIGLVADVHGERSCGILRMALEALGNLVHRGAVSADGRTGDGAGVLTQVPHRLLGRELEAEGICPDRPEDLAVGMFFLPGEASPGATAAAVALVEDVLAESSLPLLTWREVPIDLHALGEAARATRPEIRQALIARPAGLGGDDFERRLYLARRRIERRAQERGLELSVPSLSHRTLVYKGFMLANQVGSFYRDLRNPNYRTALALFHQRYSTNTVPTWRLAQPFRLLGHNGEINTLGGNVHGMRAREPQLRGSFGGVWGSAHGEISPVVDETGSDSAMLDNVLELLVLSGRDPLEAMRALIPQAWEGDPSLDPDLAAFYDFHGALMEPWDGPAAIVFSDGRVAAAILDRNGLRPQRYWLTDDGILVLGSETGLVAVDKASIVRRGRLGPGQMLAVDTAAGELLDDAAIKRRLAAARPYRTWLETHRRRMPELPPTWGQEAGEEPSAPELGRRQLVFGYGKEDLERLIDPLIEGREPIGSMGDDTPLAVFSARPQTIYRYFKQRFAQVTNPPIDPLRERLAQSLREVLGPRPGLEISPRAARGIELRSPVLSGAELAWLETQDDDGLAARRLDTTWPAAEGPAGLESALDRLTREAEAAVASGAGLLILSDRGAGPDRVPIPMLLALGAIHHHLIRVGRRLDTSLICEAGCVRQDHHLACLVGFGASAVYPYLAFESAAERARELGHPAEEARSRLARGLEKGLRKIMAKLGVCPFSSYRGGQLFEALGLAPAVVERCFRGTVSRIGGAGFETLARDALAFHERAYGSEETPSLAELGTYRYRKDGEYHAFNPGVFKALHRAVRKSDTEAYATYAREVADRPLCNLRDLLTWKESPEPIALERVEPAEAIVRRFATAAMSHGALSREAHEVLAVAMNRLGARSNSGEGGEDPIRFGPYAGGPPGPWFAPWKPGAGDLAVSAIKQVASGRFGVTPAYLASAREIEIKMAQGSKPGEGGQIPGHKVSVDIARIRRSVPGVTLISPPPHHDIYSIEDLAQLIYDLRRVNPRARIAVKLVSVAGIGTIAAGVAKGQADTIHVSGHDGGTGASPLGSIQNAGLPWELGLAEAQDVLVASGLRGRVRLRVDGGLKTGRDVVLAALLGAEEFSFGTAPLVAAGCVMARQCHLNTCPVGIASQKEKLRARFPGTPEHVIAFFLFVAEEIRHALARMGLESFDELIGRRDLLMARPGAVPPRGVEIDLSALLTDPGPGERRCQNERNVRRERRIPLDEVVFQDCRPRLEKAVEAPGDVEILERSYVITNHDRSVGARLGGEIARLTESRGLVPDLFKLRFVGSAGQSFGAFLERGMCWDLVGDAQDYVAKGLHGGEVILRPPGSLLPLPPGSVIAGNTILYGATGGSLFASGAVGERFAVRNAGARAVVEGCGDHGCEYMTGGVVVVLGPTGRNFAAGMSGGVAYVLDDDGRFAERLNTDMVRSETIQPGELDADLLRHLLEAHRERTSSGRAAELLEGWDVALPRFRKVAPDPESQESTARPQDLRQMQEEALAALR